MQIAIVGAGPAGTTAALLLADSGHDVVLVDRDPGPMADGAWDRVGVMQFHLPHTFRAPGRLVLERRLPAVHQALIDAGGVLDVPRGAPDVMANLHLRRPVFDRVLWDTASRHPRITRRRGHADDVVIDHGRVTGVVVEGEAIAADLVVDASGRSSRFARAHRAPADSADCGQAYAARLHRLRDGATPGPLNGGPGYAAEHDGFVLLVFTHDAGYFTVLLVRASDDHELADIRDDAAFERAVAVIPAASAWTDPERAVPVEHVRVGAGLVNLYRPQARGVVGLLAIGDVACTTNPVAARGVSLALMAAEALTDVVATRAPAEWAAALDGWCRANLRPWYVDHVGFDEVTRRLWAHEPLDPDGPISWALVAAAARARPDFMPTLGPFLGMAVLPAAIDPLRDEVRQMLRDGWRPATPPAPSRTDVAAAVRNAPSAVPAPARALT